MLVLKKSACLVVLSVSGYLLAGAVHAAEHKAYVQLNAGAYFVPSTDSAPVTYVTSSGTHTERDFPFNYSDGFAVSAALGYRLAEKFRLEGEFMYQSNDFDTGAVQMVTSNGTSTWRAKGERQRSSFLLNAYYDFKNQTSFTPYVTGGMGGYHLQMKSDHFNAENVIDFAYQVGAGVNYKIDDSFSLDRSYALTAG